MRRGRGGGHPAFLVLQAHYRQASKDDAGAIACLTEAIERTPKASALILSRGRAYLSASDFGNALADFQTVASHSESRSLSVLGRQRYAAAHYLNGDWQAALEAYNDQLKWLKASGVGLSKESRKTLLFRRIYCLERLNRSKDAEALFGLTPDLKDSVEYQAYLLRHKKHTHRVFVNRAKRLISKAPRWGEGYILLAKYYLGRAKLKQALRVLVDLQKQKGESMYYLQAEILDVLAECLLRLNELEKFQETVKGLEQMGRFGAIRAKIHWTRYCYKLKNYELGIKHIEAVLNLEPSNEQALRYWVQLQRERRNFGAIIHRLQSVKKARSVDRINMDLADAMFVLKLFDAAERTYQEALNIAPQDRAASMGLVRCQFELGRYELALESCQRRRALKKVTAELEHYQARCLMKGSRYQEARDLLSQALDKRASNIELLKLRQECYRALKNAEGAEADAAKIAALESDAKKRQG